MSKGPQKNFSIRLPAESDRGHQRLQSRDSEEEKIKTTTVSVRPTTASSDSFGPTVGTPRTPRFAEATSVNSPVEGKKSHNPFANPPQQNTRHLMAQAQPSDVGFGYIGDSQNERQTSFAEVPMTPNSPLKSALKAPGTPGKPSVLSPTFKEEQLLEKSEDHTEKENAKDLKVKTRVRIAKLCLRCTNFSCSLIVLSMLSSTFTIFNATKSLPKRSNLPAWAPNQQTWPQITMLSIACVSLAMCVIVFYGYWKGGHRRAQKAAIYYTWFSIAFFTFSIVMWGVGVALLNESRRKGNGNDMWGWSCKDGKRKDVFQEDVDYALVCRLQNWTLICAFIEIIVEILTIMIYAIVFYRFYSKRRLHKSMDVRDKARNDLYLAQLRIQSAPNTPGFAKTPMSPSFPKNVRDDDINDAENGEATQYASKRQNEAPKPFTLQAPPIKVHAASPIEEQEEFHSEPKVQEHMHAAPGEETYDSVPIPGAYASPLNSPGFGHGP